MKHIFKKLHHHPNRSNETPQQSSSATTSSSSTSCAVSDQRTSASGQSSGNPPASPSTTSTSPAAVAPSSFPPAARQQSPPLPQEQQQDYYASEEEYQMQLALALSVSASSGQDSSVIGVNSDRNQLIMVDRHGDSASHRDDAAADLQSRQYWDYNVLDYEEKVVNGFYDVYTLSTDPVIRGKMPSLTELETNPGGSDFEVVIVNRKIDPALEELMQIAECLALDCPTTEITLLVQRLSELVTDHLGGPVRDANIILARWMDRSNDLRTSLHTAVLPIGSLKIGLSRHRALLFKVLADSAKIPCRLVKGSHYTGVEDDAVNIIKLPNESEFLVDLMGAPGTLIPADVLSVKDASFISYNPKLSKLPTLQATNNSGATYTKLNSLAGQNSGGRNHSSLDKDSEYPESLPPISSANRSTGISSSALNNRMPSANQMDHIPSLAIGSSLYKGGRGPNAAGDGARMNVNLVPYNQNNAEDPKNLFADLNPFQVKGSGKASVQANHVTKKVDKVQQAKDNPVTVRPRVPLMWKNPYGYNELPKKNEHDFVESLFTRNNHPAFDSNVLSIPSTSSAAPRKISPDAYEFPSKSNGSCGENHENASTSGSMLAQTEGSFAQLSLEDYQSTDLKETCGDSEKLNTNHRNIVQNGTVGTKFKDKETPSPSVNSAPTIDPVIDDVSDCEIPWEDLVLGERIGLGSYGEVYHADWNGTEVAVKKFLDQDFSGAALAEFKREVRIMQRLRHPNVVLFMGAVTRPPNLSIITEFLPRGSLYRIIHRPNCQTDEKRRIKMALDVAKGMNCLHASIPTIVHRDLKSPNLLVDKNWNVKVCDFGLSRLKHNTFLSSKSTAGTPEWMAPEVLRNEPSNEKCDVYSFGVILWELATLRLPWSGMNPMQVVGAVGFQNRRLDIPKELDPLVARIIWECWQTDPNLRPSFAELTVVLKPLQQLVIPSQADQHSMQLPQEISVNSTP